MCIRDSTNPVFPYYVVYVSADGEVMTKHTQPKPALDIMRAVCSGHPEPIAKLCREFNRETREDVYKRQPPR